MPALGPRIRKLAAVAAVIIVSGGGAAAGVSAASASSAPDPAPPQYQTDHQLCYGAAPVGPGIKLPPAGNVTLDNQFGSFSPVFPSSKPDLHCNPVEKILPNGQTFGITNPSAHLLCWTISGDTTTKPSVEIANQFGSAYLALDPANQLCLPTWSSLTGLPAKNPSQPPGLSHYTCYPVKQVTSGGYTAPALKLKDEFAAQPVPARVTSLTPGELCVPTTKTVATPTGPKVYPVVSGASELLCFGVTRTPTKTPAFDQNQFTGRGVKISIARTLELCVPSTNPHLYWADFDSGTIMKANLDGTDPTTLVTGQNDPRGVAVDNNYVYWTDGGSGTIMRANLDGTDVTTLVTGQSLPGGLAVDSSHLYWTDGSSGTVMEASLTGTGVTTLESGQDAPEWVAVSSKNIYWSDTLSNTIMWANLSGTGAAPLEPGQPTPEGVAVYGSNFYWTRDSDGPGLIVRANLTGTDANVVVNTQAEVLVGLAADSSNIYWTDGLRGTVMAANVDGTGVTTIATGQDGAAGVAIGSH